MLDSLQEIAIHEKKNEGKPLLTIVCGPTKGKSTYALYTLARYALQERDFRNGSKLSGSVASFRLLLVTSQGICRNLLCDPQHK